MSTAPGPPAARAVTALLVLTAVGTAAFWIGFFTAGDALHSADTDVYLAFEAAFPVADAWMASAALAAAIGLARRRAWAIPAGIAAGSALVFLGLMDVLYDLEHSVYARPSGAMAVEMVINVFCLIVGPFLMVYFWRQRDHLDGIARA